MNYSVLGDNIAKTVSISFWNDEDNMESTIEIPFDQVDDLVEKIIWCREQAKNRDEVVSS